MWLLIASSIPCPSLGPTSKFDLPALVPPSRRFQALPWQPDWPLPEWRLVLVRRSFLRLSWPQCERECPRANEDDRGLALWFLRSFPLRHRRLYRKGFRELL